MTEPILVKLSRWFLIILAIVLSPIYGLWLLGGKIADWRERRRCRGRGGFNLANGQFERD